MAMEKPEDTGWLDTMTGMVELNELMEIKDKLADIDFVKSTYLKNKINAVLDLDERTYQKIKKITHNYLISLKYNRSIKEDIQILIFEYHRQLYTAYTVILDSYYNQNKIKLSPAKTHLLFARLFNATFMMCKWRYFDDQPAPVSTWDSVCKFIKTAENLSILNKNLFLYDFQTKETSIATLLKRGFMLDTLQKSNYSNLQIELADRVLKIWATNPLIVNTYKVDRYQFHIKFENDSRPERVRAIEKYTEGRYWRTTRLLDLMEDYLLDANANKPLRRYGLEKIASTAAFIRLFKKLRVEWCVEGYERQRRREERKQNNKLLNVSYGLEDICARLMAIQQKRQQSDKPEDGNFTFELQEPIGLITHMAPVRSSMGLGTENWWMVDESEHGFAVDFGKDLNDLLDTGVLVGYNTDEDGGNQFSIAEIKSLKKGSNGKYRAGLEILSKTATTIQISSVKIEAINQTPGYFVEGEDQQMTHLNAFLGLLLDDDHNLPPRLIIPRSEYKKDLSYMINIDKEDIVIKPGIVLSKNRKWTCFATKV